MKHLDAKQIKTIKIVIAYPFALILISVLTNLLLFDVNSMEPSLPNSQHLYAMIIAGLLLIVNHSVLMTTTEITRVKYRIYATPEEWKENGTSWKDISEFAIGELGRHHNAHRNLTENTCYFIILTVPFLLISPSAIASYSWLTGFALSRLGYTVAYISGRDQLRGIFMSLSLVAMYGIASYMAISALNSVT